MIEGGGERLEKEGEKGGGEENRREEREEERGIKMNQDKHEWKSHLEVVLLGINVVVWTLEMCCVTLEMNHLNSFLTKLRTKVK